MKHIIAAIALTLTAAPALADTFTPVSDESAFLALVEGRQLDHTWWSITLDVREDGNISGTALGWDVTGSWEWRDGYFCRDLRWGDDELGYNCQLVEVSGTDRLRFTVDRGAGRSAAFNIR